MREIKNRMNFGCLLILLAFLCLRCPVTCSCNEFLTWVNEKTGYKAVVSDQTSVLSSNQAEKLLEQLKPLTSQGNAAVVISINNMWYLSTLEESEDLLIGEQGIQFGWKQDRRNSESYRPEVQVCGRLSETVSPERSEEIEEKAGKYVSADSIFGKSRRMIRTAREIVGDTHLKEGLGSWQLVFAIITALLFSLWINMFLVRRTRNMSVDPVDILARKDGRTLKIGGWKRHKQSW